MTPTLSAHQTRLLRIRAQRLSTLPDGKLDSPRELLNSIVAVQAQDLGAARLSMRARSASLTQAHIDQAREQKRSLVWTWCLRGTLHLVAAQDAGWLVQLLGAGLISADRRRMNQLGWDESSATTGIKLLEKTLGARGRLTRPEVTQLLAMNGLPHQGQATFHLIYRAALEGLLVHGAHLEKEATYVLSEEWLGEPQPFPPQQALARLAKRYLAAYAPAGPEDLASWSGLKLRDAREAWGLISEDIVQVQAAGQERWMLKSQLPWLDEGSTPIAMRAVIAPL